MTTTTHTHSVFVTGRYASIVYIVAMCLSIISQYCTKMANTGSHKQCHTIAEGHLVL